MDASLWVPDDPSVPRLETAASDCRGCELWQLATQVVFSAGPVRAALMVVGEQPGDHEDLEGEPFVGPAGRLLDEALTQAGTSREEVYLTNAVKHFRFEERGKRRIHRKPDVRHISACHPWLEAELDAVTPDVVVALGATAGRAVLGRPVRIGAERGLLQEAGSRQVVVTTHPSAVIRLRGRDGYDAGLAALVADLRVAVAALS
ncbi:UdgX family uracil-DNA binding protein [Nocardioides jiangxiensis]|uniref:Type-4 uracil-DNA glycosylase n=1 Tax=Nocardioides jiangxiensis TaxID=3064524 RepID=A0ABT9B518_9ACTN|nr:UdgX family uracil-DNA binding protein [Nocardioides sp. WY-20]MDO7868396.1 UdgX family uracil-DNA binding protein [Nocardioides sp. WY-20]